MYTVLSTLNINRGGLQTHNWNLGVMSLLYLVYLDTLHPHIDAIRLQCYALVRFWLRLGQ